MNAKIENPPAFPVDQTTHQFGGTGMTLRDYFAAQAMQAMCAGSGAKSVAEIDDRYDGKKNWREVVAMNAYEFADAMLEQHDERTTEPPAKPVQDTGAPAGDKPIEPSAESRERATNLCYDFRDAIATAIEEARQNKRETCEHCGSDRIYHGPPDCPACGAPNCCRNCCERAKAEAERDRLRAENEQLRKGHKLAIASMDELSRFTTALEKEQAEKLTKAEQELAATQEKLRIARASVTATLRLIDAPTAESKT